MKTVIKAQVEHLLDWLTELDKEVDGFAVLDEGMSVAKASAALAAMEEKLVVAFAGIRGLRKIPFEGNSGSPPPRQSSSGDAITPRKKPSP